MTLVVDAGVLYAQADRDDPEHAEAAARLVRERGPLITSQVAVAEADYLILDRLGVETELAFLDDLAAGTFVAEALTPTELATARDVVRQHRDLRIGLADASLVLLARRYRTRRLASFDERAFRTVAPLQGGTFTLLPADERSV